MQRKKSGINRNFINKNPKRKKYSFSSGKRFKYNFCYLCKYDSYTKAHKLDHEISAPSSSDRRLVFEYCRKERKYFSEPSRIKTKIKKYVMHARTISLPKFARIPDCYENKEIENFVRNISKCANYQKNPENKNYKKYLSSLKMRFIVFLFLLVITTGACGYIFFSVNKMDLFVIFLLAIFFLYVVHCLYVKKFEVIRREEIEQGVFEDIKKILKTENERLKTKLKQPEFDYKWELGKGGYWLELWKTEVKLKIKKNHQKEKLAKIVRKKENPARKVPFLETEGDGEEPEKGNDKSLTFLRSYDEIINIDEVLVKFEEKYTGRKYPSWKEHKRHASHFI